MKNGVILGSLFAAIGTLLLGKNRRKLMIKIINFGSMSNRTDESNIEIKQP